MSVGEVNQRAGELGRAGHQDRVRRPVPRHTAKQDSKFHETQRNKQLSFYNVEIFLFLWSEFYLTSKIHNWLKYNFGKLKKYILFRLFDYANNTSIFCCISVKSWLYSNPNEYKARLS